MDIIDNLNDRVEELKEMLNKKNKVIEKYE